MKDGFCFLGVKDNGIGIAPDKLNTLFNIDTSNKTFGTEKEPGTGLGLILCREFIQKHGGTIEVVSEPGKGSEFRIVLPVS
jgi:signal transduction histidine kinase